MIYFPYSISISLINVIAVIGIFFLMACDGSSSSKLKNTGAILKLDRSDSIAGPDLNGNGVRDDIDAYILYNYTDPKQVAAMFQMARAVQKEIILTPKTVSAAIEIGEMTSRAIVCAGSLNFKKHTRIIIDLTTNTKARLTAFMEYNDLLNGTVWSLPTGNTCE